jgi:hypothetical protein
MKKIDINFNINIEGFLHSIDKAFKDRSKSEVQMIYIMIFGTIFSISYLFFWESSLEKFMTKLDKISSLMHKINSDKLYMKLNPEEKIIKLNNEIIKTNEKVMTLKENNEYIKHKIDTISSLIYNENTWGEYLHSISKNAKDYNIKILNFTNDIASEQSSFGHILDISLKSTGNYLDTLKFINSLEENDLVVDIHHLDIKANEKLYTDLNISVWGIRY